MATDTEQLILSISADTAQIKRALARLPADAKTAAQGVEQAFSRTDPVGRMQQNLSRSMKAVQADAKNLSFQISDIATGLSTGQSPFMIMNQQMGQVTQILGGQGLTGALAILKSALASSWPMLALIGISALASATIEYFTTSEKEAKEATKAAEAYAKAIQKQLEVINKLREAQGLKPVERGQGQLEFFIAQREAMRTNDEIAGQLVDKLNEVKQAILGVPKDAFEGQTATILDLDNALTQLERDIKAGNQNFFEFAKTLEEIEKRGNLPDNIRDLVKEVIELAAKGALSARNLQDLRDAMDGVAKAEERATEAVKRFNKGLEEMGAIARAQVSDTQQLLDIYMRIIGAARTMGEVNAANAAFLAGQQRIETERILATPSAGREFLKTKAATPAIGESLDRLTDAMVTALVKLFQKLPESARITSGVRTFAEQAKLRADFEAGRGGLAAPAGRSRHEFGKAVDIGAGVSMEQLREAVKLVPELEQLKGRLYEQDKVHVQLSGTLRDSEEQIANETQSRAEKTATARTELEKMITTEEQEIALKEQINAINADVSLSETQRAAAVTLATAEAAKAAEVEKLVNQAKEAGLAITPQLIAQYNALAQAKVNAVLADQQIAVANKQAAAAEKERVDALKQLNQQAQQMVSGAITGFIQDLRNGVEAGEAFNNMLNRIIDSLINMAIQMAVKSLFGGGGILGNLFSVAHSGGVVGSTAFPQRRVDPRVFIGAPRMATGGLVGGEVPIIAHRGEMVIPKSMVGRSAPVQEIHTSLGDVNVDMSGTGLVAADSAAAKQFGQNVQRLIQIEMVQQSRPGGLLRRVPG